MSTNRRTPLRVATAPLRVSLAGGGTDLRCYFEEHGGAILSATIDKSVRATLYAISDAAGAGADRSSEAGATAVAPDPCLAAVAQRCGIAQGTLTIESDVPPGSGLGFSSAAIVAALKAAAPDLASPALLARTACDIERSCCASAGCQDAYAAAYGGLNWMELTADAITVTPVCLETAPLARLQRSLVLMFTGRVRRAAPILDAMGDRIRARDKDTLAALARVRELAYALRHALGRGEIDCVGEILHESWQEKKRVANGISDGEIDDIYQLARRHGALGGKIVGAGGGGHLLVYVHPERREELIRTLTGRGLRELHFGFSGV